MVMRTAIIMITIIMTGAAGTTTIIIMSNTERSKSTIMKEPAAGTSIMTQISRLQ